MKFGAIVTLAALALGSAACTSIPMHEQSGERYDRVTPSQEPEVLLIHGMFMTPKCWNGWIQRIGKAGYHASAPAWPLHSGTVEELRDPSHFDELVKLELPTVVDRYRRLVQGMSPRRPVIAVGHSMGGLVAQILLAEGTVDAAVVIHSAPPHGVFGFSGASLRSNWQIANPLRGNSAPLEMSLEDFSFAFANQEAPAEEERVYKEQYVPESRRVGRAPLNNDGDLERRNARGPLLVLAGGQDHIIPSSLSYRVFKYYDDTPGYTEFMLFPERDHWTIGAPGWEEVADKVISWIERRFPKP
jgi:pimeloyl-ACP methyl ester carboxylesterase